MEKKKEETREEKMEALETEKKSLEKKLHTVIRKLRLLNDEEVSEMDIERRKQNVSFQEASKNMTASEILRTNKKLNEMGKNIDAKKKLYA